MSGQISGELTEAIILPPVTHLFMSFLKNQTI